VGDELSTSSGAAFDRRALLAAETLLIDHCTAQVVTTLHTASVRPILLKGPAIARWLYAEDPAARDYADVDLLVAPQQMATAEVILKDLGFVEPVALWLKGDVSPHGGAWVRAADGATVDLHRTIHGCELLPDEAVWRALSTGTTTMAVAGVEVTVLGLPARVLHVVLHLEALYGPGSKPWEDLTRALQVVDLVTWGEAVALARALGVEAEMGIKLRRSDAGRALADPLGLPRLPSPRLAFYTATGDQQAVARLVALVGWRAKLAFLAAKLLPPREYLRQTQAPLVDRSRLGLVLAYGKRLGQAAGMFPKVLGGWVRARQGRRG